MRRGKGLLITIIVIIIILVIALVGIILSKFVLNKGTNKNNQKIQTGTEAPPVEENELKVGDYIAYVPDRASNYVVQGTEAGAANNDVAGIKQENLNWRVLNINDDGTVDIISEEVISTEVYFSGALGYNNGVYILNDICEKLYSNKNLKAKARSINLDDIESKMSDIATDERDEYSYKNVAYGDRIIYEGELSIPEIYIKSDIDEESESYYSKPTMTTFVPQDEIELENTFYELEDMYSEYFEEEDIYEILFGNEDNYWLATRCTDCSSEERAIFGLRTVEGSDISGASMCTSNNKSGSSKNYIRPIVTLGKSVEISSEGGTKDNPKTILDGNISTDDDDDLVYDAEYSYGDLEGESYTGSLTNETYSVEDIKVPYINIDSSDAEDANIELEEFFEEALELFEEALNGEQDFYVKTSYEKYIDTEIASIVVKAEVGNEGDIPKYAYVAYNFNISNGKKLSYKDVYQIAGLSSDELEEKVEDAITEELRYRIKGLAEEEEENLDELTEQSIENYKDSVEDETIKYFIDEDENLNIIVDLAISTYGKTYTVIVTIE